MPARFHLARSEDQKQQCPCCGRDVSEMTGWRSEFHLDMHYKQLKCDCGYNLSVKVDFSGSGHDEWNGSASWKKSGNQDADEELANLVDEEHSALIDDIEIEED